MPDDLALALQLADVADEITRWHFRAEDLVVRTKPDLTPVSEADQAVEQALRARLAELRPGDAVVGEEYGQTGGDAARRWIIDPIDGTKNYVRGLPIWATLIALEDRGELTVGVVSAPSLSRRWWAVRGEGAFLNGARLRVSAVAELSDAMLLWSGIEEWDAIGRAQAILGLARQCWRSRGIGDFWQYMLVAEGAAEIAVDPVVSLWDLAAPSVIVEEAGGQFSDFGGERTVRAGDAVATNGALHDDALRSLRR